MSAGKHTPGPWEADQFGYITANAVRVASADTDGDNAGLDRGEGEANARLIAAAPDLLRALHYLSMQASVLAPDDAEHQIHSTLATARAVIAKATGGQP